MARRAGRLVSQRELLQHVALEAVDAAIPRPQHDIAGTTREQDDDGAAAPHRIGLALGRLDEVFVDDRQPLRHGIGLRLESSVGHQVGERVAHHAAGHFALTQSAHSVGHCPQADVGAVEK